jgi:hypothetical protein
MLLADRRVLQATLKAAISGLEGDNSKLASDLAAAQV